MAAYVDKVYYDDEYEGIAVDESEFNRLEKRSSEIIDQLTQFRINDINNWHNRIQTQIKKAVCAQIEYFQMNGGYEESQQNLGNVRIGSFSYNAGDSASSSKKVPSAVIDHLKHSGLLYTGVHTHGY